MDKLAQRTTNFKDMNICSKNELIDLIGSLPDCAVLHVTSNLNVSADTVTKMQRLIRGGTAPDCDFDGELHIAFYKSELPPPPKLTD